MGTVRLIVTLPLEFRKQKSIFEQSVLLPKGRFCFYFPYLLCYNVGSVFIRYALLSFP